MSTLKNTQAIPVDEAFDDFYQYEEVETEVGEDADPPADINPEYEQYQADRESLTEPTPEPAEVPEVSPLRQAMRQIRQQNLGPIVGRAPEADPVTPAPQPEPAVEEEKLDKAQVRELVRKVMEEGDKPVELSDDQLAQGEKITASTVVFELTVKMPGWTKKQNPITVIADQHMNALAMLRSSKKLLECAELDEITRCVRRFRDWLDVYKCRTSLLRGGMYLVPLANVEKMEVKYQQFKVEFAEKVATFIDAYETVKQLARATLGELYEERQYKSATEIVRAYWVSHRWLAFDAPKAMTGIKGKIFAEASEKLRLQVANAAGEMEAKLVKEVQGVINNMVYKLTGSAGSTTRKEFTKEKAQEIREFFEAVQAVNLTGNNELGELLAKAEALTNGVDLTGLGDNDGKRAEMADAFKELKTVSDGWVVDGSVREFTPVDDL